MTVPERRARPHHQLLDDGRTVSEVLTYTRRGSRFTPRQQQAWDEYAEGWVIPDEAVDAPGFAWSDWFDREAPLIVDIGGGIGEATAALAAARPSYNVVGLEVWKPGVAESLGRVGEAGASNVRFCSVDALWTLEHLFVPGSISEMWTFFPDPWHKARHNKRRMINAENAAMLAERLAPGATWRLATDWADYADQIGTVLGAEPRLEGGIVQRWDERPVTKFERKGLAVGRSITDFGFVRTGV